MAPHMPTPMAFPASHHVDPQVDPQAAQPPPPAYLQPHFHAPQMAPPTSPEAARHMAPPAPPQPRPGPLQVAYVGMPMPPPRGYQIAPQAAGSWVSRKTPPRCLLRGRPSRLTGPSPRANCLPRPQARMRHFTKSPRGESLQASPPGDAQEAEKPAGKPRGNEAERPQEEPGHGKGLGETRTIQPAPKRIPNASNVKMNAQAATAEGFPHPASIQESEFYAT